MFAGSQTTQTPPAAMDERYEVLHTTNLFLSSDKGRVGDSRGDDFDVNLASARVDAHGGEMLRVSLIHASMYRTFTHINERNDKFDVRIYNASGLMGTALNLVMPNRDHSTHRSLASDFAEALTVPLLAKAKVNNAAINGLAVTIESPIATSLGGTGSNMLSILFTATAGGTPADHGITEVRIQCYSSQGDSYAILGGLRIDDDTDLVSSSLLVTVAAQTLRVQSYCPMQRFSDWLCAIRLRGMPSQHLATTCLNSQTNPTLAARGDVHRTDILGLIWLDSEVAVYTSSMPSPYFVDVPTTSLQDLRVALTDANGNPLPRAHSQAATRGNLSFNAVLRIDTIRRVRLPHNDQLAAAPPRPMLTPLSRT